jgi:hypothetical protein
MKTEKDNLATRFLLGKLTAEESVKLEENYFGSDKLFEEILFAESELIDAYAAGRLAPEDHHLFENRLLLNPRQLQRVEFAKTLAKYASNAILPAENLKSSPANSSLTSILTRWLSNKPMLSLSFAVAAFVLFGGGLWLVLDKNNSQINQSSELSESMTPPPLQKQETPTVTGNSNVIIERKPQLEPPALESGRQKPPRTEQEVTAKKETPVIFSIALSPGLTREGGISRKFTIPPEADLVKMQLNLEADKFSSYRAALKTVEGQRVWSSNTLKPSRNKIITVLIPSKLLKKSDYILALKGINQNGFYERVEDYTFTINR